MRDRIYFKIQKAIETGLFHMMVSSVIKNILAFISGIIIVRIISKSDYGIYAYANNTISYFTLLSGLGISSAVFQVCCERRKNDKIPKDIFSYGVTCGYLINTILGLIIIIYSIFTRSSIDGSQHFLLFMSFIPVVNIAYEFATIYYRCQSDNKNYALLFLVSAGLTFIFSICGSLLFGIWGMIISNYLTPIFTFLFATIKKGYKYTISLNIKKSDKKDLWKLAITSMTINAITNTMYLIDISMIGMYLKDETQIATYKVATTIPTALVFLSSTIVAYVYPYFAEHINDMTWTKKMSKKLVIYNSMLFGTIAVILFVFANPIVQIVFGKQYSDVVGVFRILSISFFFQCSFRIVFGNLLVAQRKLKFNLIESILSGVVNIIGDYFFIQKYQAVGIAMSTLSVMIFSSFIVTIYYFYVLSKKGKNIETVY